MKNLKYISLTVAIVSMLLFTGCNYLDIVPDEIATEEDAFKDVAAAERYLYSCYAFIPNPRSGTSSIDFFTSDEVVTAFEHETFAQFPKGNYTASNPVISYWNTLFQGIRECYLLLDNVDNVPGLDQVTIKVYKAEATFLIAYYHYLLLKCYGPTLLIKTTPDINMPVSDYPARSTYDECVEWIAAKFDEAIASGLLDIQPSQSYGRATKLAAMSIKARMLLYAASPLFNGSKSSVPGTNDLTSYYNNFKTEDGKLLISTSFDITKWEKAAAANLEAINAAESAGFRLYENTTVDSRMPEPADPLERKLRMVFIDKENKEVIWSDTRKESTYDLQNKSTPYKAGASWNGVAPTITMLEFFYTKNGLPIQDDPEFDYANRYGYSYQADGKGSTLNLNQNREPRFYSWISFHNGFYEVSRGGVFKEKTLFRSNDNCGKGTRTNNFSPTGYLNKKGVPPLYSRNGSGGKIEDYSWPIVRLAELYLNYAEALVELNRLDEAKIYIDKVRIRGGLKSVDESWQNTGITLDQNKMREIVRQERTIELYLENHRFWDIRRWLLGEKYFNVKARGLNVDGTTDATFFKVTEVNFDRRFYVPQHYLMPFPIEDMNNNTKIIQNPGY